MANTTREIAQQIVTNGYELIQLFQSQSAATRGDIRTIAATLRRKGVMIDEEPTLQQINSVLDNFFAGYSYGGLVTPESEYDSSITADNNLFYFASTPGVYTNYGEFELGIDDVAFIMWSAGTWELVKLDIQKKNQVHELPEASASNVGLTVQYVGATTESLIHGWFYEVIYDEEHDEYKWQRLAVQKEIDVDAELDETSTNPVENRVVTQRINLIISKVAVAPTYVSPTFALNQDDKAVEMGEDWSGSVKATFTQNDAGAMNTGTLDGDDWTAAELAAKAKTKSVSRTNITTTQTISASGSYDRGPQKLNNFDIPDDRGRIAAGTKTASFTITPSLHYFYGHVADDWTISSANVRALTNEAAGNKTLATGTTHKKFVVAIPANKSITEVIDTSAVNADITSQYVLQGTYTIKDAGGNDRDYKVYIMTMAVAYSTSHNHSITIA